MAVGGGTGAGTGGSIEMDREIIRRRRMSVGVNECGASNMDGEWNLMEFNEI